VTVYPQDVTYRPRDRPGASMGARGMDKAGHKVWLDHSEPPTGGTVGYDAPLAPVLSLPALSLRAFGCSLTEGLDASKRNGPQGDRE